MNTKPKPVKAEKMKKEPPVESDAATSGKQKSTPPFTTRLAKKASAVPFARQRLLKTSEIRTYAPPPNPRLKEEMTSAVAATIAKVGTLAWNSSARTAKASDISPELSKSILLRPTVSSKRTAAKSTSNLAVATNIMARNASRWLTVLLRIESMYARMAVMPLAI
mmetsp:Transcript_75578/g.130821  ORF Transcript_75578/g.130821 Transcript_75578/m.130821 type:complete len:165 (+) Transcript_75578:79-573(+)